jgi:hypothetical protein
MRSTQPPFPHTPSWCAQCELYLTPLVGSGNMPCGLTLKNSTVHPVLPHIRTLFNELSLHVLEPNEFVSDLQIVLSVTGDLN